MATTTPSSTVAAATANLATNSANFVEEVANFILALFNESDFRIRCMAFLLCLWPVSFIAARFYFESPWWTVGLLIAPLVLIPLGLINFLPPTLTAVFEFVSEKLREGSGKLWAALWRVYAGFVSLGAIILVVPVNANKQIGVVMLVCLIAGCFCYLYEWKKIAKMFTVVSIVLATLLFLEAARKFPQQFPSITQSVEDVAGGTKKAVEGLVESAESQPAQLTTPKQPTQTPPPTSTQQPAQPMQPAQVMPPPTPPVPEIVTTSGQLAYGNGEVVLKPGGSRKVRATFTVEGLADRNPETRPRQAEVWTNWVVIPRGWDYASHRDALGANIQIVFQDGKIMEYTDDGSQARRSLGTARIEKVRMSNRTSRQITWTITCEVP